MYAKEACIIAVVEMYGLIQFIISSGSSLNTEHKKIPLFNGEHNTKKWCTNRYHDNIDPTP